MIQYATKLLGSQPKQKLISVSLFIRKEMQTSKTIETVKHKRNTDCQKRKEKLKTARSNIHEVGP